MISDSGHPVSVMNHFSAHALGAIENVPEEVRGDAPPETALGEHKGFPGQRGGGVQMGTLGLPVQVESRTSRPPPPAGSWLAHRRSRWLPPALAAWG